MSKQAKPTGVAPDAAPRRIGWLALPALLFATVAALFAVSLKSGDPSRLPSAFIGKPAPAYAFAPVEDLGTAGPSANGFDQSALAGGTVTVVNFWGSWCAPCVEEHPQLITLGKLPGVTLAGVNYKDTPANARKFLTRYGNPFALIGADRTGRGAIEWGVYGTPETFIIDGKGRITFKHVGPISPADVQNKIRPAIEAARRSSAVP